MDKDKILEKVRKLYEDNAALFSALKKQHENSPYTVDDQIVKESPIVFVFSCPGQEELIQGKVCYGKTGDNLNALLKILHTKEPTVFPSDNRYKYNILNASNRVHYEALDGKTEEDDSFLQDDQNKKRIQESLANCTPTHIIFFGKKAEKVVKIVEKKAQQKNHGVLIITGINHVGFQGLNHSKVEIKQGEDPTQKRLEKLAEKILKKIEQEKKKQK